MCISNKFVGDVDATGCQPHFEKHCLHLQSTAPPPHMFPWVLVVYTGQFLPFIPSRPQSLCSWLFSKLTKVIHLEAGKVVRKDPGENPSSKLYASGDRNLYTHCRDNEAHLRKPKKKEKKLLSPAQGVQWNLEDQCTLSWILNQTFFSGVMDLFFVQLQCSFMKRIKKIWSKWF